MAIGIFVLRAAGVSALGLLAACTTLPKSGPDDSDILKQAAIHYSAENEKPLTSYFLVDLSEKILSRFKSPVMSSLNRGFGSNRTTPPNLTLGVGDVITITLFESSAGGLFIPSEAGSRPGNYITLPQQTIDTSGMISVPYAGLIKASGATPAAVQQAIESRLADRAIEPQALISVVQSRSSEVSVLGDVNASGKFPINPGGDRVLDAVSRAGGISAPAPETYLTLQRNGKSATVMFDTLLSDAAENVFVYPGDIVFVNRERRTFLAFGASGTNGRYDFEESNLTLAEAVGKAGGLLDDRADPGQVFLYRLVSREDLQALGMESDIKDAGPTFPVIFKANLRDPSSFFLAQQFPMQDKDIVYVGNADSVELLKVFNVVNATGSTLINTAANAKRLTQ